ncbi:TPA: HEPN domain-containing protein [bacterium]|nr:HEPN domain-containing protein [bacterium]
MSEIAKQISSKLEKIPLPFKVISAVLFGSRARGAETPLSDVDILVVAEGINPKFHRRSSEIAQIKRHFPGISLDILLFTTEEVISNFKNHNPLFLDIVAEGIILIDRDNFISHLIEETREYIRERGIKKLNGGWQFPTIPGIPTYLSKITNKDFSFAMLKDGERDALIGERLLDYKFYDKSVYHSQQSIEKSIKAILIAAGIFQRNYFVGSILREVVEKMKISDELKNKLLEAANISESIEAETTLTRYPAIIQDTLWLPSEEYTEGDAEIAKEKAETVLAISREFLKYWFKEE